MAKTTLDPKELIGFRLLSGDEIFASGTISAKMAAKVGVKPVIDGDEGNTSIGDEGYPVQIGDEGDVPVIGDERLFSIGDEGYPKMSGDEGHPPSIGDENIYSMGDERATIWIGDEKQI